MNSEARFSEFFAFKARATSLVALSGLPFLGGAYFWLLVFAALFTTIITLATEKKSEFRKVVMVLIVGVVIALVISSLVKPLGLQMCLMVAMWAVLGSILYRRDEPDRKLGD